MTEKLYDFDSYLTEFTATVVSCKKCDGGFCTVLNKTAFFPEEGGQCCDTGTLNDAAVLKVILESDGTVTHITDHEISGEVIGKIDFKKRFRNMQNHTGEHILSGLFYKHFGFNNVGFHLGSEEITMDISGFLNAEQLKEIEEEANAIVFKNVPIKAYYPTKEELNNMFYRSKGGIDGDVRIVKIGEYDVCACCAPHVNYTGEVGLIKIVDFYKNKNFLRLQIKCGFDALYDYQMKHNSAKTISADLKSPISEISQAVKDMQKANKDLSFTVGKLKREAVLQMAENTPFKNGNLCVFASGTDRESLRILANTLKEKCNGICAVLSENEQGFAVVIASNTADLNKNAPKIFSALNGVGGGSKSMFFGTLNKTEAEITEYINNFIAL